MALLSRCLAMGRETDIVRLIAKFNALPPQDKKKSLMSQAQYSSAHMMVRTRMVALGLVASSECWLIARS